MKVPVILHGCAPLISGQNIAHILTHVYTQKHTHTGTQILHTHTHTHALKHKHKHTHTHTIIDGLVRLVSHTMHGPWVP